MNIRTSRANLSLAAPAILLLLGTIGFAQPDSPLGGSVYSVLPNGMTLICREQRESPLVAIDLWIRAGSAYERPDEHGAAHFLEHMLFKGTASRGPGEIDAAFEDIGSILNAGTSRESVHLFATVSSSYLNQSLETMAD